jgi:uncharacterized protein
MTTLLTFLAIGLGAGVLSGLFGIGGGIVIVPALIYLAKLPPQTATGTSLAVFLLPVGLLGAMNYYRAGHVNAKAALLLGLGVFVGGFFGSKLNLSLPPTQVKRAFAVLLLFVATRMWFGK